MKRLLLICFSISLAAAGSSQNIKEYSLSEVRSSDDLEYERYTYNSNLLLKATDILFEDGTKVIDSLRYDEFKNVVKLDR